MSGLEDFQPRRGMVADFDLNPMRQAKLGKSSKTTICATRCGSETGKIRPCIIVTNNIYNSKLKVIQVVPITEWSEKKSRIVTNVTLSKTKKNGLSKKSIADCLQTRPIDYTKRFVRYRGKIDLSLLEEIDRALVVVFGIDR